MNDFSFLKNGLILVDTGRLRNPKSTTPEGMILRVMANGSVYPSKGLADKYKLEYTNRGAPTGNGIDVINTKDWELDIFKSKPPMLLMGFTNKNNPKVDLFGTCRYNDDNTPKSSVMTQGGSSAILTNAIKELGYMTEEQKYCDLVLLTEYPITMHDGIANIPKIYERGVMKGSKTYQRREHEVFYPAITFEEYEERKKKDAEPIMAVYGAGTTTPPADPVTTNELVVIN